MEKGLNVGTGTVKGGRSYPRLNSIRQRMVWFAKAFEKRFNIMNITKLTEEQLITYFSEMRSGEIKTRTGKEFTSVGTYGRIFKAFWHWHMKVNRKNKKRIEDITIDLDIRDSKPKWVYLTEQDIRKMCNKAKFEYKVLIMFLYDSGIRSPGELINILVSDLYDNCKELHIRDEISKTFGRKIKLMLSSDLIKEHVLESGFQSED